MLPTEMKPEEKENLQSQLNQAMVPLTTLVEEAKNLVSDARTANMKNLERNADTLRKTLQAACNRLRLITGREKPAGEGTGQGSPVLH